MTSTDGSYVGIPVIAGKRYRWSFWSASPEIGNGHKIEHGFSKPLTGWHVGAGNTEIARYLGGGAVSWKEYSGTFTVPEDQSTWYLGGMANGGRLQFDSIFIGRIPENGALVVVR